LLDAQELNAYEGTDPNGAAIRKQGFRYRDILPVPRYINPDRNLLSSFETRLFDYGDDPGEFIRRIISTEARLLRLGGIKAETRSIVGMEQPWSRLIQKPIQLSAEQVRERLRVASKRLTTGLKTWWQDHQT
jgi:hypothetical protein